MSQFAIVGPGFINYRYVFVVDGDGVVLTRNPSTGRQAIIQMRNSDLATDAVTYLDFQPGTTNFTMKIMCRSDTLGELNYNPASSGPMPKTSTTPTPLYAWGSMPVTPGLSSSTETNFIPSHAFTDGTTSNSITGIEKGLAHFKILEADSNGDGNNDLESVFDDPASFHITSGGVSEFSRPINSGVQGPTALYGTMPNVSSGFGVQVDKVVEIVVDTNSKGQIYLKSTGDQDSDDFINSLTNSYYLNTANRRQWGQAYKQAVPTIWIPFKDSQTQRMPNVVTTASGSGINNLTANGIKGQWAHYHRGEFIKNQQNPFTPIDQGFKSRGDLLGGTLPENAYQAGDYFTNPFNYCPSYITISSDNADLGKDDTISSIPGSILELVPDGSTGQTQRYRYPVAGVEVITAHDGEVDGQRKLRLWLWDVDAIAHERAYLESYNGDNSGSGLLISGQNFDATHTPERMLGEFFQKQKRNPNNTGSSSTRWCPKIKLYEFDGSATNSNGFDTWKANAFIGASGDVAIIDAQGKSHDDWDGPSPSSTNKFGYENGDFIKVARIFRQNIELNHTTPVVWNPNSPNSRENINKPNLLSMVTYEIESINNALSSQMQLDFSSPEVDEQHLRVIPLNTYHSGPDTRFGGSSGSAWKSSPDDIPNPFTIFSPNRVFTNVVNSSGIGSVNGANMYNIDKQTGEGFIGYSPPQFGPSSTLSDPSTVSDAHEAIPIRKVQKGVADGKIQFITAYPNPENTEVARGKALSILGSAEFRATLMNEYTAVIAEGPVAYDNTLFLRTGASVNKVSTLAKLRDYGYLSLKARMVTTPEEPTGEPNPFPAAQDNNRDRYWFFVHTDSTTNVSKIINAKEAANFQTGVSLSLDNQINTSTFVKRICGVSGSPDQFEFDTGVSPVMLQEGFYAGAEIEVQINKIIQSTANNQTVHQVQPLMVSSSSGPLGCDHPLLSDPELQFLRKWKITGTIHSEVNNSISSNSGAGTHQPALQTSGNIFEKCDGRLIVEDEDGYSIASGWYCMDIKPIPLGFVNVKADNSNSNVNVPTWDDILPLRKLTSDGASPSDSGYRDVIVTCISSEYDSTTNEIVAKLQFNEDYLRAVAKSDRQSEVAGAQAPVFGTDAGIGVATFIDGEKNTTDVDTILFSDFVTPWLEGKGNVFTYRVPPAVTGGDYKLLFYETDSTYRVEIATTNDELSTDAWFDSSSQYFTTLPSGNAIQLSDAETVGTGPDILTSTTTMTVDNNNWCVNPDHRYTFSVSGGKIVTVDDDSNPSQFAIKSRNDAMFPRKEFSYFRLNSGALNDFYCNVEWSVFRKSDGTPWISSDEAQLIPDAGEQIDVKLNGSAIATGVSPSTGALGDDYLTISHRGGGNDGTPLADGTYGVCNPSSATNNFGGSARLGDALPNAFCSVGISDNSGGTIRAGVLAGGDCFAGIDVYLELVDESNNNLIASHNATLPSTGQMSFFHDFTGVADGSYTVRLKHGRNNTALQSSSTLYDGISFQQLLDEATGVTMQNSWCNNNLYAFQVLNGKIVSNGFKGCDGLADIFFANGRYCDVPLSDIFESNSGTSWSSENAVCTSTLSQAVANVTISGLKASGGKDIKIFSGGTPLDDGWYAFCTSGTQIGATPQDPGACGTTMYHFQVGSTNGEITTQVEVVNGQTTETKKGFLFCPDFTQSISTGGPSPTGIPFPDGSYCSGGQNNGAQQQIQVFSKSAVDDSDQWTTFDDACLACNATTTNVDIRGNTDGILTASVTDNSGNVIPLPQGTYSYCHAFNSAGFQINVTPNSSCQNEYFIYISNAQGDWDGKIYDCSGNVDKEVDQNEWFDESQLLNYGVKADGNPWTGSPPPSTPPTEACGICSDETSDKGTLYVSGNSGNATDESEQLRVYTSPAEQNPLGQGWYRSCSNSLPVANGVAPSRPKFNCYGNPFIWYSLKNKVSTVVDENSYLTNGSTPWYIDAPLKDLTSTGCDLAVVGWEKEGPTSKSTILRGEYTSLDNTLTMQCSGVTGYLLDFNPGGPYLTRSANFWYPNPETGQKIISSPKTTATEMTIAILVSCETTGTIFKITDVSTVEGSGEYDKLDDLSATLSSIELKKVAGPNAQSSGYELTTVKNDFVAPVQNSITAASQGGYEIVVITLSETGHTIRVDGIEDISDSNPSNFCSDNIGITNLNVEIGDNKDDEDASGDAVPVIDMNFLEMIIYDEELNLSEIEELEGYLSHKWCSVLAAPASGKVEDEHPYRSQGPVCGGCDDDCCDSGIHVVGEVLASEGNSTDSWRARCFYASSDPVFGYQFKLTGDFSILDIPDGLYEEGTISVGESASAKEYTLSFEDPLFKSFKNYIQVTPSGIWVYGHFNKHSEDHGGFDYVLPKAERNTGTGFAQEHFLTVTLTQTSGGQVAWGTIGTTGLADSESGINTPAAPHPLLVTDISGEQSVVRSYTGDATGNGSISRDDVRGIIERISTSHENGPYDLSGNSWLETLDANGKGWLDISDAVTCLMNLIRIAGTHLGDPAPVIQDTTGLMKMMSGPICSEKLTPTKCEPCPCPDEPEDEECISRVWISDIQQISTKSSLNSNFAIVTVSYQSSCCIDGYKLTLGGFNDKIVNDEGGFHDGAVLVPSYGNALGQLTDGSETHVRGWLHGLTLDPSYKGDVAFENASEVFAIGTNIVGDLSALANKQFENKLNFPIVWGMSLGQNPLIPTTAEEKIRREQFESGRLGANCIPPTCKGESRILTKFVINMRSFLNPHIAEFRLVTNDNATTPASFGSDSSPISWTGDSDTNTPANGISGADFAACLVFMYSGWGPSTTWDNPTLNDSTDGLPPAVSKFDAENDDSYIDIVDSLTVINHILMKGNDAASDTTIPIVPSDCCPCPTPGSFTVSLDVNPCDCTEEGYVSGKEGQVTITWTESSETKMYVVYRVLEEYHETSTSYSSLDPWNTGLYTNKTLLDIDVAEKTELIFAAKNQSGNSQSITDFGKVQLYKDKIAAAKRPTDFDKWTLIGKFRNDETSVIDKNPISFEKCCPDDVMPRVKYVVVALNDCGQKNVSATYTPECCGDKPAAKDVDIGTLAVNDLASLYSDVYHPFAMNPYGGFDTKATASITVNSSPSVNTVIKLIAWDGTVHECTLLASTSTNVANELAALIQSTTGGGNPNNSKITADVEEDGLTITLTQSEATICGNTKITVSGDTAAITADERFTGGNKQCIPGVVGYPERCEKLAFFITSIVYSSPRAGDGLFVGPSGGGALPVPNLTGFWSWKPPVDYIGDVTLTYVVVNESGCSDTAKITINYAPPKLLLDCETPGCDEDDYGKVKIKMKLPDIGNAAKFIVLRKPVTTSEWHEETHTLMDDDGNPLVFSLVDYPDNTFIFVDENVTSPDELECCNQSISYHYKIKYCVYNTLLLPNHQLEFATATDVNFSCAESTVCTVTIPCCPKPRNVIPSVNVAQDCSSSKYAEITITWDGIVETDSPYLYLVYKRKQGTSEWNEVVAVDATPEGKADSNPYWDSANNRYEFVDKIKTSSVCADNEIYEYAIVTMNADKILSGDPSHESWGSHIVLPMINQGDPCSPGGTTVTATVENCPTPICVEDMNVSICLDEDFEYDLAGFVSCIPNGLDGNPVSVSYALTSSQSWVTPSLSGSVLTFNTRNIDFGTEAGQVGTGPHTDAITVTVSTAAPCASSDVLNIDITLIDCGCPCPDDEADYTICDNNYDNEEYVEASKLQNNLEQIPFSLTNEGGQTLRKGQPYVVSKGKIDCD